MSKILFEKIVEAPAEGLEKSVNFAKKIEKIVLEKVSLKKAGEYWDTLGPGLVTGAADDDPSGIATYSQAGAKYNFQLLWLAIFSFPLMAVVQEMCARIGMVTGQGLAANIKKHFSPWVIYSCTLLLTVANTFNIGADLGAMAKGVQLIFPQIGFFWLILAFTLIIVILQIYTSYATYAKYLKYLALVLLSYVVTAFVVHMNWASAFKFAVFPSITFSKDQIFLICGILGTTISPYLFFWQTSQEVEEEILDGKNTIAKRKGATAEEIKKMRIDVWSGMFVSNAVMFFIIAVCGTTLFAHGITNIGTASDAAAALRPLAGDGAYFLFALGIVGTGMLAIPVLAGSTSYAVSECFNWKSGLYRKLNQAYAFYGVIIISMVLGFFMNFIQIDPIKALIYSGVANAIIAPVIIVLIILISSSKKIMGKQKNGKFTHWAGWLIFGIMSVAGIAAIVSIF